MGLAESGSRALVVDGTAAHEPAPATRRSSGTAGARRAIPARARRRRLAVATPPGCWSSGYAATDEQFLTIAKLRAARRLWARMLELCGASEDRGHGQHAVTSPADDDPHDPWVNLLRTTRRRVRRRGRRGGRGDGAAVRHRLGLPDAFGRRMARNTSSLLIEESHVAAVTDPAGGSYAVEKLTADLAEAAWAEFGRSRRPAGSSPRSPTARCGTGRRGRPSAPPDRHADRPITGVSEFPNLRETLPERSRPPRAHCPCSPGRSPSRRCATRPAASRSSWPRWAGRRARRAGRVRRQPVRRRRRRRRQRRAERRGRTT